MNTLFLDFASNKKSLALVEGKKVVLKSIDDHTDESKVMPLIESLGDFDRIVATTGPGGFMSLRVGLSLANALAWAKKIPVAGVHLSDVWSARVGGAGNFLWMHSTKKEFLFIRGFGKHSKEWPEAVLIGLEDAKRASEKLAQDASCEVPFVGELIPEQAGVLSVEQMKTKSMEDVLPEICKQASDSQPPLLPWYGRGA